MAGSTGLEPAASAVTGRRSSQLNYDPNDLRWNLGLMILDLRFRLLSILNLESEI
jgi:hypothetical protein